MENPKITNTSPKAIKLKAISSVTSSLFTNTSYMVDSRTRKSRYKAFNSLHS